MPLPKDRSTIKTNLPQLELQELCEAIENPESSGIHFQQGISYTTYFECQCYWRGFTYRLSKINGIVTALHKL